MPAQKPQHLRDETIFPGAWGKGMIKRVFTDPRTGKEEDYYLFHSDKVASIVMILTKQNEVVAIKIFCQAANEFILQVPGGVRRAEESFEDTARREVLEETGYRVGKLVALGKGWFEPFNTTTPFMAFLATECERVANTKEDGTEYLQVEVYPWAQWWDMCLGGTVEDAKSVLVTTRALGYLNKPLATPPCPECKEPRVAGKNGMPLCRNILRCSIAEENRRDPGLTGYYGP